jgi:preprotein translocase subunit SecA
MPTLTPQQLAALRAGAPAPTNGEASGADRDGPANDGSPGTLRPGTPAVAAAVGVGSVTSSSGAAARTELIPGLAPSAPRRMQLQRGDETVGVASDATAGTAQPAEAAKLGRNDPCWCGSGKKFKRCHGS